MNKYYESENLKIYYIEDTKYLINLDNLDNNCFIFLQFPYNIHNFIENFNIDNEFPDFFNSKNNVIYCSPDEFIHNKIIEKGKKSIIFNHNCLLDYNLFSIGNEYRIYNAVINSRPFTWKRVYLAKSLDNLVYIKGADWTINNPGWENKFTWDGYKNMNLTLKSEIGVNEVSQIYQQSMVGLILSGNTGDNQQGPYEGACYSSSEYLLSGLPVVSTPSGGGRDFWFDNYNSIICEPIEESVKECVDILINRLNNNEIDRELIRNNQIEKMNNIRKNFIDKTEELFKLYNINIDAYKYFNDNYFHKFLKY